MVAAELVMANGQLFSPTKCVSSVSLSNRYGKANGS